MNLLSYFIVGFFYFYGFILLYITYLTKKKGEIGAFYNNLINSLVLLFSISTNFVIINFFHITDIDFLIFPFDTLLLGFLILFFPFFYFLIRRERNRFILKKNSNRERVNQVFKELPIKYDFYRKLTHLVVLGIIFFYFTLGLDKMIFTHYLVVFLVGISLIGFFTAEFTRILKPEAYPLKPIIKILREKERHMRFGPHISMGIGCFSVIIIYGLIQPVGPLIICTSMTMSIFGDITSNLFGRTFGKKKIRNTNKTYEGLIAGIIAALISGIIVLLWLNGLLILNIMGVVILPLIGALLIGLLDYLDLEVDDNLTYNFMVSSILFLVSIFIV